MHTRWGFYFRNSISSLKKSIWIILGLSLAISMIAGISFYYDAFENDFIDLDYWHMDDVSFQFSAILNPADAINFSEPFNQHFDSISDAIEVSDLSVESYHKYGYLTGDESYFKVHFTEYVPCTLTLFDSDLYSSTRFNNNIELVEGDYPDTSNEVLVDYVTAHKSNYSVGSIINLTFRIELGYEHNVFYTLDNIEISGLYALNELNDDLEFQFDEIEDSFDYTMEDLPISSFDELNDAGLIFGFSNFTSDDHPFQYLYDKIYTEQSPTIEKIPIIIRSGTTMFLDRSDLRLNRANSIAEEVVAECSRIRIRSDADLEVMNYFSERILSLDDDYNFVRYFLLFLNIPIFIGAILFASFGIKLISDRQKEEYLLMRSRGMPKSMILKSYIIDMFMLGVVSSALGIMGGLGTFYGYRIWLQNLEIIFASLDPFSSRKLPFIWSLKSIGIIIGVSAFTVLLSSISGFKDIKRIGVSEVLGEFSEQQATLELNEEHIFGLDGVTTAFSSSKRKKPQKVKKMPDKTKKWSILLILIGIIPILFYIFIIVGSYWDSLSYWATIMSNRVELFFPVIFPICGLCLCIGVIRLLTLERRRWFAKIISKISSVFLKRNGYILGVNLSQKKRMYMIMFLVCGFCGILIQSNVYINSKYEYDRMYQNLHIGADCSGYFRTEGVIMNNSILQQIEDTFYSLNTSTGENIVLSSTYIRRDKMAPTEAIIDYVNFSLYYDMLFQDGHVLPETNLQLSIESLIDQLNKSSYVLGFADEDFLYYHDLDVGDLYTFSHEYNNFSESFPPDRRLSMEFTCKIVDQMDIIPGIDPGVMEIDGDTSEIAGHLTIDSSCLDMHPSLLHGGEIFQLIDYNESLQISQTELESQFKNLLVDYSHYQAFAFYEDYSDVSYTAFSSGSGYYGIVYMDLLVIGVFFSIAIALFLSTAIQKDRYIHGILLSRGFGRKRVIKYALSQWFVVIMIPLIVSIIIGGLSAIIFAKILQFMTLRSISLFSVPINVNFWELGIIFSGILGISFLISILPFILRSKKEISHFLHKF